MNTAFGWSSTATAERDVPVIRLKNDSDLREMYEFGSKLGQGSFGEVYEATHLETQTKWAIKMVHRPAPGSKMVETVDNEISILKQVNHAHIIHLETIYNSAAMIYLVTELCKGGDLKQLLQQKKSFTEDETRKIIFSLADAIVYLHQRNIVHRDLKLENILLKNSSHEDDDSFDIKVADFGLSVKTGGVEIGNIMTEACGTLIYMAPEMMSGRGYSQWCDVWSIGVIMFMLLCGEPPFVSKTQRGLLKKIMNKVRFTQPAWASVSDAAKWVLTYLLKVDPAYRMTARQLLETPWIAGDNTVPSGPNNVLEMIDQLLENDENENRASEPVKDWSPVSSEDTPEPSLDHCCWSQADLSPEADTPSTPHRTVKESTQQKICILTTAQCLAGVKCPTQLSAKGRKSKTDVSTGQKTTSNSSKTEDRPSPTSKGLSSFKQRPVKSPTLNVTKTNEKQTNGAIPRRKM